MTPERLALFHRFIVDWSAPSEGPTRAFAALAANTWRRVFAHGVNHEPCIAPPHAPFVCHAMLRYELGLIDQDALIRELDRISRSQGLYHARRDPPPFALQIPHKPVWRRAG